MRRKEDIAEFFKDIENDYTKQRINQTVAYIRCISALAELLTDMRTNLKSLEQSFGYDRGKEAKDDNNTPYINKIE